jgi:membrane-associated phospholipid phosphatase
MLTIGGMILNVMVLPTLLDENAAVPRLQSFPSSIALGMMTMAYVLLELWLPALATLIGCVLWLGVAVYRSSEEPS